MEVAEVLGNVDTLDSMGYADFQDQNRLLGAVMALPEQQKRKAVAKLLSPRFGSHNLDARDKTMQRIGALPEEIRRGLAEKKLQLVDAEFYSVKFLNAASDMRFFADADTAAPGLRNISGGKLPKDTYFCVTEIQFTMGVSATATTAAGTPSDAFFDTPSIENAVLNGEFDFKASGNKYLMPKDSPLSLFGDVQFGGVKGAKKFTHTLANPKWIEPQVAIEFNTRHAAAVGTGSYFWGKFKMIGCAVTNY